MQDLGRIGLESLAQQGLIEGLNPSAITKNY